jgi:maltoporin
MKNKFLLAALPLALACGSLSAQDVFELHGYVRAGVGQSSNGGEQVTFYLPNTGDSPTAGPGYRLGNETDDYLELAMDVRAYDKGNESFKLHFRPTFREYNGARDSSIDAGGAPNGQITSGAANNIVFLRESWGEATGFFGNSNFFKDAVLWAGRRFYQRHDDHERDFWYWNNSGDGVGLEQMNAGFAKVHYAIIQNDNNQMNATGTAIGKAPQGITTDSHDLRFTDIGLWKGGVLSLGVRYDQSRQSHAAAANNGRLESGFQVNAMWNQGGVLGGDNTLYLTHANGSTFWNWYNPQGSTTHDFWNEAVDVFFIKPCPNFEILGNLIYRVQDQSFDHQDVTSGSGTANDWKKQTWMSYGARPTYFFTKHFSLALDLGMDRLKFSSEASDRWLFKKTLAAQWQPQSNIWSRPSLRLFVTNANWGNNTLTNAWGAVDGGQFSGAAAGMRQNGTTYGAQVEAWW